MAGIQERRESPLAAAWPKAEDYVNECINSLPKKAEFQLGPFKCYNRLPFDGTLGALHYAYTSQKENISTSIYYIGSEKHFSNFSHISVAKNTAIYRLYRHLIMYEDDRNSDIYPKVKYYWAGGAETDDNKGKLKRIRFNPFRGTFITYSMDSDGISVNKTGNSTILYRYPDTIDGLVSLNGMDIPWNINYDQHAEKILRDSALSQFTSLATQKFRSPHFYR